MSDAAAPPPAKSSKKLIIIGAVVVLLVVIGAAAWFMLAGRHSGDEESPAPAKAAPAASPKTPPTYLPMDNMVVNLADPGGDRFAQVGISLELADAKTADTVKSFMPSIRSAVLMLVSQRTADELLTREGKEKLALDIRREVSRPLGFTVPKPRKRKKAQEEDDEDDEEIEQLPRVDNNPVRGVLFSSFIIQ